MKIEIQLISFLAFIIFGIVLGTLNFTINTKKKKRAYIEVIILTPIFMYILYHINGGKIHPYFLGTFFIGILISKIAVKSSKKFLILLKTKYKR